MIFSFKKGSEELSVVSVLARLRDGRPEGSEGVGVEGVGVEGIGVEGVGVEGVGVNGIADIAFLRLKFIGPFPDRLRAGVFIGGSC